MQHPQTILSKLEASARKSLSQSFLTSDYWAEKLAKLALEAKPDRIIEIGPGLGALTQKWAHKIKDGIVIEYDRKLAAHLREEFPTLFVIESDVLRVDLRPLSPPSLKTVILSNLPYHISSPIFFSFLESGIFPARMILTFQKEFADRLAARPREKEYGALSVLAQTYYEIELIGVLPAGAFYPKPTVASAALLIRPRFNSVRMDKLKQILRAAFAHRRKLIIRNLEMAMPPEKVAEIFARLQIPPKSRAEELTPEQYWLVTEAIS